MAEVQPVAPIPRLSREQKMGFVFLLVFAVVGLVLGILQIRNTLFAPFALSNVVPASVKENINDVEKLRYRDTDNDGLTDFDETYNYGTSPYLYDSFGYGLSDKDVIEKGLPRCANAGKNCATEETVITAASASSSAQSIIGEQPIDIKNIINDPKQIREMLLKNGMTKDVLDKVNDAELLVMIQELMASTTLSTSTN
ncbi:MAG: hypothetical protein WC725_04290 [Patescibacteria group bacterium]|jgi:hypothetical protein